MIDEPKSNGGQDLGPDPFTMIVAGLIGCTLTTLRMYIRRKGWLIDDIRVDANMVQQRDPFRTIIVRAVVVGQPVTEEQSAKLLHIAKNCPAARLLEGEIVIDTVLERTFAGPRGGPSDASEVDQSIMKQTEHEVPANLRRPRRPLRGRSPVDAVRSAVQLEREPPR